MKINIKGSITPPRGTPGANGAYLVDLDVELPVELVTRVMAGRSVSAHYRADRINGEFVSHMLCRCGHYHECIGRRVVSACPVLGCEIQCSGFGPPKRNEHGDIV